MKRGWGRLGLGLWALGLFGVSFASSGHEAAEAPKGAVGRPEDLGDEVVAKGRLASPWQLPVDMASRIRGLRGGEDFESLRVSTQLPRAANVNDGRRIMNDIRRKIEKRYGKNFLAGLKAETDRGRFVSALEKTLTPGELGFAALILTALGEARGQVSEKCRGAKKLVDSVDLRNLCVSDRLGRKNLLLVMKVIENRSEERRFVTAESYGRAAGNRIWGAVTLPLKYSSWNPSSPNLQYMFNVIRGAQKYGKPGDLKNSTTLAVEDSVALDRAYSVYADYVSPGTRYRDFERSVDARIYKATHMLNEQEKAKPEMVGWTIEAILEQRERLAKAGALSAADENKAILVGLRLPRAEIRLPGESDSAARDVLAHVPVYVRPVANPTLTRLKSLREAQ